MANYNSSPRGDRQPVAGSADPYVFCAICKEEDVVSWCKHIWIEECKFSHCKTCTAAGRTTAWADILSKAKRGKKKPGKGGTSSVGGTTAAQSAGAPGATTNGGASPPATAEGPFCFAGTTFLVEEFPNVVQLCREGKSELLYHRFAEEYRAKGTSTATMLAQAEKEIDWYVARDAQKPLEFDAVHKSLNVSRNHKLKVEKQVEKTKTELEAARKAVSDKEAVLAKQQAELEKATAEFDKARIEMSTVNTPLFEPPAAAADPEDDLLQQVSKADFLQGFRDVSEDSFADKEEADAFKQRLANCVKGQDKFQQLAQEFVEAQKALLDSMPKVKKDMEVDGDNKEAKDGSRDAKRVKHMAAAINQKEVDRAAEQLTKAAAGANLANAPGDPEHDPASMFQGVLGKAAVEKPLVRKVTFNTSTSSSSSSSGSGGPGP